MEELREQGTTVLVTTHYLEEADKLCDRIAIIDHGTIKLSGTPSKLKNKMGGTAVSIEITNSKNDETKAVISELKNLPFVKDTSFDSNTLKICITGDESMIPKILKVIVKHDIDMGDVTFTNPTLDDVFLHHTGYEIKEEKGKSHEKTLQAIKRVR